MTSSVRLLLTAAAEVVAGAVSVGKASVVFKGAALMSTLKI